MKIALVILALTLTSCAAIREQLADAKAAPRLAKAIDDYCLLPQSERAINRSAVNDLTQFGDVVITCVGDL